MNSSTEIHGDPDAGDQTLPQPELLTIRLILRPFNSATDPASVEKILECRDIAANTRSFEYPYPPGAATIWIGTHGDSWRTGKSAVFAICWRERPETPIGAIGLHIDEVNENAELGYWVDASCWGQGVCSEAGLRIVAFGFEDLGLNRIHAHHMSRNRASGRVLEKIGMQREGHFREHIKKWGVFEDAEFYGLLASDFCSGNSGKASGAPQIRCNTDKSRD